MKREVEKYGDDSWFWKSWGDRGRRYRVVLGCVLNACWPHVRLPNLKLGKRATQGDGERHGNL